MQSTAAGPEVDRGTSPGRVPLALIAGSLCGYWLAALSGPSVVSHALPGGGWLPPYSLDRHPAAWLVIPLLWAATAAGAAGTWLGLRALRRGWAPRPALLVGAAAIATVAFAIVPPVNSDDVYSYAAYGRMAATGLDPYTTTPRDLPADPVALAVTPPWQGTPSVYGPIATWQQTLVMKAAGPSVRWGVLGLGALGALGFLATAGILDRYAADEAGRRRAALCWALNPVLIFQLVGGAHLDTLGIVAALAAVILLGRRQVREAAVAGPYGPVSARAAISAGAAVGAAIAVKLTGGIAAIGLALALRRQGHSLVRLVTAGVLVVVPLYLLVGGSTALGQVRRASRFVSFSSWWRGLAVPLERVFDADTARQVISLLALVAFLALTWLLTRALPPAAAGVPSIARYALAPSLAWLLTASYTLPWYAGWAWPLVALVAASRWDDVLLAWMTVLTFAYIPGRVTIVPAGLGGITRWARSGVAPVVLAAILAAAVVLAIGRRSTDPAT